MCAEYNLKVHYENVAQAIRIVLPKELPAGFDSDQRVRFTVPAPVVVNTDKGPTLAKKIFPAHPFPNSRLSGFDGDEDSADADRDIRRIYDVPLWKKSFAEHPILAPMTSFFEPVYWGEEIGTVQEFSVPGEEIFFVAGLLIRPRVPKREGLDGFSLLTHTATPQMLKYHQRLVTILKPDVALGYLEPLTPLERFDYLIKNRYTGPLTVAKDRNMAKGWEKKVPLQTGKLHREEAYVKALGREHVKG